MSRRYINREKSWLEFNARVLDEALNEENPLLERLRFLSIFSTNLDEFFMVRVAGLIKMREEGISTSDSPETIDSAKLIEDLRMRTLQLIEKQHECFASILSTLAEKHQVKIAKVSDLSKEQKQYVDQHFRASVYPVLTPLAYDATHPFPFMSNLSLYMVVQPEVVGDGEEFRGFPKVCFVEIPTVISRLIRVPIGVHPGEYLYVTVDDVINAHMDLLFVGVKVKSSGVIRVTRNLDYNLLENTVVDLLKSVSTEMHLRQHQEIVRIEVQKDMPAELVRLVCDKLQTGPESLYYAPAPLNIPSFVDLASIPILDLRYENFNPRLPARFAEAGDIFSLISEDDILVHHPYESFYTVTEFVKTAAYDPNVLAIKQMLYRTGGDSPVIQALIDAAAQGKHVTAVVELKARFDEKNNIVWARQLEQAGVNVVFGFVDLKTHSKATLVVRREGSELRRYAHLSTGNYNSVTARIYTDVGLFTKDEKLCEDVAQLFNLVTGVNVLRLHMHPQVNLQLPQFHHVAIAPLNLRSTFIGLIHREIEFAKKGIPSRIIAKMNALVDGEIIDKLYEASRAGVKIQLIVRGICCLRPGEPNQSENIEVISLLDRFLEHSRIYYFSAGGADEVFLSSADWMPRNMDRRVELMWPVKRANAKRRLIDEILAVSLADNTRARRLRSDGVYENKIPATGEAKVRAQFKFIELARAAGIQSLPYDAAMKYDPIASKGQRPFKSKMRRKKSAVVKLP